MTLEHVETHNIMSFYSAPDLTRLCSRKASDVSNWKPRQGSRALTCPSARSARQKKPKKKRPSRDLNPSRSLDRAKLALRARWPHTLRDVCPHDRPLHD